MNINELRISVQSYYSRIYDYVLRMRLVSTIIHRCRFTVRTFRMLLQNKDCFRNKSHGYLLPLIRFIFTLFRYLSLITLFRIFVYRKLSQRHVDVYIFIWLLFYIASYFYLDVLFRNNGFIPELMSNMLVAFSILRIVDILQTWFHVLLIPPFKSSSQRVLVLTVWNYFEIAILYGILGYLFHAYGYYDISEGNIQLVDSIRFSLGIVTPLGIPNIPRTWTDGAIFYTEYLLGLFFLIIVISKAVSYVGKEHRD